MEQSINRVERAQRTGNRPTLRHTPNGTPLTHFSLYTFQLWRNASGELCEAAERHAITAWGQLAIQCCKHLHKGSRVHITGRLQTRRWDDPDAGEIRLRTEVIASEVVFLGGIQQSQLPPDYYLAEQEDQMPTADAREVASDERDAASTTTNPPICARRGTPSREERYRQTTLAPQAPPGQADIGATPHAEQRAARLGSGATEVLARTNVPAGPQPPSRVAIGRPPTLRACAKTRLLPLNDTLRGDG